MEVVSAAQVVFAGARAGCPWYERWLFAFGGGFGQKGDDEDDGGDEGGDGGGPLAKVLEAFEVADAVWGSEEVVGEEAAHAEDEGDAG